MKKDFQYFTLVLLIIIATRLLYPYPTGNQDRSDLFLLQDAKDFLKSFSEEA
jgi:hypothetical protein